MIRRHVALLRLALMGADAVTAAAVFLGVALVRFHGQDSSELWTALGASPVLAAVVYGIGWVIAMWLQGLYRLRARWSLRGELVDVLRATALIALATLALLFLLKLPDVSRLFLLLLFVTQPLVTLVSRIALRLFLMRLRERGKNRRFVLVVGTGQAAEEFADWVERHRELGLRVAGHLRAPNEGPAAVGRPVLGTIDDIERVLHEDVVDEVAICLPAQSWDLIEPVARLCEDEGKIVRIPLDVIGPLLAGGRVEEFEGRPVLSLLYGPDRVLGLAAKRAIDLVVAAVALLATSPFFLAIAVAILAVDGRPILFRQTRLGLHGRPFTLLKFRTMVPDAEERRAELAAANEIRGPAFKVTNDPRRTALGRYLRRSSLDELPQIWNVLRGEMSLVGPRPPLPYEVQRYDVWHRRRLSMKPGITGLWQVGARRESDFDRWVAMDLDYIDRWSLWLDLKIMLRTIPALLMGQGR